MAPHARAAEGEAQQELRRRRLDGEFRCGSARASPRGALAAAPTLAAGPEKPRYGGTVVTVLGADPAVLNPGISVGVPDVFVGCILYDSLIRFGKNFEIVPNLAKSWEISKDGLTYTFHLEKANFTTASR
jgi:ABC-type transport system substrate-binding protein